MTGAHPRREPPLVPRRRFNAAFAIIVLLLRLLNYTYVLVCNTNIGNEVVAEQGRKDHGKVFTLKKNLSGKQKMRRVFLGQSKK
jgi:hypothetical protein